ncbi:MAG TPA: hypothetical protein DEB17_05920 [Chlorobaculum sp.]|uniref:Uncharacterized protein n=1 Tax=Chlorobaculum tepidum (strain ATCC 49652 / DSM 12025 / NBRC 103806 / TLS) TaxID=194439 RepID=Q8KF57_CHLTE|nr:hypothetical protein CT0475 [Chlorobaculum tepidum TLS]HBU23520.1 hypothetical protein [Chlorobaculum sp.]
MEKKAVQTSKKGQHVFFLRSSRRIIPSSVAFTFVPCFPAESHSNPHITSNRKNNVQDCFRYFFSRKY